MEDLFSINCDAIEEQRLKYEPHRELLVNIQERLQDIINEDKDVEDTDDEEYEEEETTNMKDIEDFEMKVKGIKGGVNSSNVKFLTPLNEVKERVRMLNSDQRIIFNDLIERLWCNREDKKPFHV